MSEAPPVTGDRLGLIVGHSLPFREYEDRAERRDLTTSSGRVVTVLDVGDFVTLPRHGLDAWTAAHELDHRSHIEALAAAGCGRLLALASCGSLRTDWPVGTVAMPDDFFAPHIAPTFFDDHRCHSVPGFDDAWRGQVLERWRAATGTPILDGGVYAQTRGPRFETPAEVRYLATFADLVGMTLVAECVLAREAGLPYAAICVVDNLANGLGEGNLTEEEFRAGVARNQDRLRDDLAAVLPALL